jgi:PhnB protein
MASMSGGRYGKGEESSSRGIPYGDAVLTLDNAAEAIDWYKKALGAQEVGRNVGPDGKVMRADLRIGNSRIMLHDAMMGAKGPRAMGGSPASL